MRTFLAAVSSVKGGSGGLLSMSAPWRGVDRSVYVRCSLGHVDGSVYNERMNTQTDRTAALPRARQRAQIAQAVALAIDGASVRAQFDPSPDVALAALRRIINALLKA